MECQWKSVKMITQTFRHVFYYRCSPYHYIQPGLKEADTLGAINNVNNELKSYP
jgi:hypothetical protein